MLARMRIAGTDLLHSPPDLIENRRVSFERFVQFLIHFRLELALSLVSLTLAVGTAPYKNVENEEAYHMNTQR